MTPLQTLYDQRAKAYADANDYRRRVDELDEAGHRSWNEALSEVERLDAQIEAEERGQDGSTDGRNASPGQRASVSDGLALGEGDTFSAWSRRNGLTELDDAGRPLNLSFRKYLRGLVTGEWTDAEAERRAMSEGVLAGGGYMVPTSLSSQIIDLARNQTRVLQAGARVVPMATKKVTVPRWEGDPTANWRGEGDEITPSDATLGAVELDAQSLASLTIVSRELLEDAQGLDDQLKQAFAAQFAAKVDRAALYGTGTDPEPRGVKQTSGVGLTSMGANGAAIDWDDLLDAVGVLEDANETPNGVIYSPRTDRQLAKLRESSTGQYLAPPTKLANLPRYATNQVPNNLTQGTATAASDVFVGDWSQLYVGLRVQLQIQILVERYANTGEIGFLGWYRGDTAVARPKAFNVVTGVIPPA